MRGADRLRAPEDAVAKLMECLVLSFAFSSERDSFVLVCDYPDKAPSADRAFVALVFEGVRDFSREAGDLPELVRFKESFAAQSWGPPIVIQAIRAESLDHSRKISLWFGPNFGGLRFRYESVTGYERNTVVKEVDGDFLYRDAISGQALDFYHPFPEIAPKERL